MADKKDLCLIENDFGTINFDAQILHADFIRVNRDEDFDLTHFQETIPGRLFLEEEVSLNLALRFLETGKADSASALTEKTDRDGADHDHTCQGHLNHTGHEKSGDHDHDSPFISCSIRLKADRTKEEWKDFFDEHWSSLLSAGWCRAKGFVRINGKVTALQWTGRDLRIEPAPAQADPVNALIWIGYLADEHLLESIMRERP